MELSLYKNGYPSLAQGGDVEDEYVLPWLPEGTIRDPDQSGFGRFFWGTDYILPDGSVTKGYYGGTAPLPGIGKAKGAVAALKTARNTSKLADIKKWSLSVGWKSKDNKFIRVGLERSALNPMKGSGGAGAVPTTHIQLGKTHIILNPFKWSTHGFIRR